GPPARARDAAPAPTRPSHSSSGHASSTSLTVAGRKGIPSSRSAARRRPGAGDSRDREGRTESGSFPSATASYPAGTDMPSCQGQTVEGHDALDSAHRARLYIQESADAADEFINVERLLQEVVGARGAELRDLVLLDHP